MKNTLFYSVLAGLVTICTISQSQIIYQWRGNDRKGIYNEHELLKIWPSAGPQLLWSVDNIGNGYGSPTITNDRIYITGEIDTVAYLFALDLKGKLIWKSDFGKEWVKTFPGSRSAPTVDGELIYITSGMGNLACFDAKTGVRKWFVDMMNDLHGQFIMHGHSESPLIDGEKVFLVPGGRDTNVVAFNKFTGKILWICKGKGERPAYNSPLLIKLKDRNLIVTFSAYNLMGIDTKNGELLWVHEQDNTPLDKRGQMGWGDTHSNTAWYENGFIYYIAGDGNGAVKLQLSADGKEIKQVWRNQDIDNYMGGFIVSGNTIYSCVSEKKGLRTIDANTGKVIDSLKCGTGTIISAEDMLYYYNQKGEMFLIKPDPAKPEIVSNFKITAGTKEHFSHPVIKDGVLYLRHGKVLLAYDIKAKKPQ
jgi:outer membrane protein assembly factor BamB